MPLTQLDTALGGHADTVPAAPKQQTPEPAASPTPAAEPVAQTPHVDAATSTQPMPLAVAPPVAETTPPTAAPVEAIAIPSDEHVPVDIDIDDDAPDEPDLVDVDDSELLDTAPVAVAPALAEDDDSLLQVQQVERTPAPFSDAPPPPPANTPADLIRLQRSWQEVVNTMGSRSPSGAAMIREAMPVGMDDSTIILKFVNKFNVDRLAGNERGRKAVEDIINRQLGVPQGTYRIKCVLNDPAPAPAPVLARQSTAPTAPPHEEPDELLETVIAVFGGNVIDE